MNIIHSFNISKHLTTITMKTIQFTTRAFFLLCISLIAFSSFAQTDFTLSDYKNPDYQYHSLDFGFNLTGNNTMYKSELLNGYSNKQSNHAYDGMLNANYYAVKNSQSYQGSQNYWLGYGANGSSHKNSIGTINLDEATQKFFSQQLGIGAYSTNRFYNVRKQFIESNLNFSGELGNSSSKHTSDLLTYPYTYKNQSGNHRLSVSLPLLIGIGRIEEVQDARLAVYILDDLLKTGKLKKTPDKEAILAFARFITQTKNQRYFDSRIRKIAEITAIDSFLTGNGLKNQSDAGYYTRINDNWDNSNGPVRATGSRFAIGLTPAYTAEFDQSIQAYLDTVNSSSTINYKLKNTNQLNIISLDAVAQFVCEKPIRLTWQRSTSIDLGYSLYNSNSISKNYENDLLYLQQKLQVNAPDLHAFIRHAYSYYPNSRTSIRVGASAGFQQQWFDEKTDDNLASKSNETTVNSDVFVSVNYYFSPQLQFTINLNEQYLYANQTVHGVMGNPDERIKTNSFSSLVHSTITYSLF